MNSKKGIYIGLTALALLALAVVVTACSSGSVRVDGQVTVLLTDAPIDLAGVNAVNVTVTGVSLLGDDEDGQERRLDLTTGGDMVVNLLDYRNGKTVPLATGLVPDGDYSKIRLHVSAAQLARDDDGDPETPDLIEPVFNPSGKVDVVAPFTLSAGDEMTITLDFDAALSIHVNQTNGQHPYILRPVINVAGMH